MGKRRQWRRNTNSGRQAGKSENVKGFKNPHKPTQAQFTGQTRPVKAPELERRVNRFLAGEDKGTEKKKKLSTDPAPVPHCPPGPHGIDKITQASALSLPLPGLLTLSRFQT